MNPLAYANPTCAPICSTTGTRAYSPYSAIAARRMQAGGNISGLGAGAGALDRATIIATLLGETGTIGSIGGVGNVAGSGFVDPAWAMQQQQFGLANPLLATGGILGGAGAWNPMITQQMAGAVNPWMAAGGIAGAAHPLLAQQGILGASAWNPLQTGGLVGGVAWNPLMAQQASAMGGCLACY